MVMHGRSYFGVPYRPWLFIHFLSCVSSQQHLAIDVGFLIGHWRPGPAKRLECAVFRRFGIFVSLLNVGLNQPATNTKPKFGKTQERRHEKRRNTAHSL